MWISRKLRISLKEVCQFIEFSYQKLLRWRKNCSQVNVARQQPGPKKLKTPDWKKIKQEIDTLNHGNKRSQGTGELVMKFTRSISRRGIQNLIRNKRLEIRCDKRKTLDKIQHQKVNAVWSMDDSMVFRDENGRKMTMHVVRDLSSKYQFAKPSYGVLSGEDVAQNLEGLIKKYGAPMFLKSDLGLNLLRYKSVIRILKKHFIIPIPSPGYYPQYNGSLERGNGEIKSQISDKTLQSWRQDPAKFMHELPIPVSTQNHEPRRSLDGRCSCEKFHHERLSSKWTKKERKSCFDWIIQKTKSILNNESVRGFKSKDFWDAWRSASLTYLELKGYVKVEKGTDVSTTFSSNCYH